MWSDGCHFCCGCSTVVGDELEEELVVADVDNLRLCRLTVVLVNCDWWLCQRYRESILIRLLVFDVDIELCSRTDSLRRRDETYKEI